MLLSPHLIEECCRRRRRYAIKPNYRTKLSIQSQNSLEFSSGEENIESTHEEYFKNESGEKYFKNDSDEKIQKA